MAVTKRANPRDVTGARAAQLADQHAPELAQRAGQLTTLTAPSAAQYDEYDYDAGPQVTVGEVSVDVPMRKMRVNDDVEQMTFGYGTSYDFQRGITYTVPVALYNHLEEIGLVYH